MPSINVKTIEDATKSFSLRDNAKIFFPDEPPRKGAATNTTIAFWAESSQKFAPTPTGTNSPGASELKNALIYVVDDLSCLLELYTLVLEAAGHRVKAFDDRKLALADLKQQSEKPALLITDFRNSSMCTQRFLEECVAAHPHLRIMMASGSSPLLAWTCSVMPDRFIQKPFTAEQLQNEVLATLADLHPGF